MANKYAVASGLWSSTSTWSDTDGGAGGAAVPVDNDTVFICSGALVQMDVDQSGFANGIAGLTIRGGATPGMLYWKDGASGILKIKDNTFIQGTTDTNRGRLLANSDGVWGHTTPVSYSTKAGIIFGGSSTTSAGIKSGNLDIALHDTEPTIKYVRTYGTAYTCSDQTTGVSTANDTITFSSAPPASGTMVRIRSSGTLPAPLSEDYIYYTSNVSGNSCKLALISGGTVVDITTTGSGTLTMYSGHTNTSTKTINILDDPTGDPCWNTTAGNNRIVLCNESYLVNNAVDIQKDTMASISSSSITLTTNNINSKQAPWSRIYLTSRNVFMQFLTTRSDAVVISYEGANIDGVFSCEMGNYVSATSYYGSAISDNYGNLTISGTVVGCTHASFNNSGTATISGTVVGCNYASYYNYGSLTISGQVIGCNYTVYGNHGIFTISGPIIGCNYASYYNYGIFTISGQVIGCNYASYSNYDSLTISGPIIGCNYASYYNYGSLTISGPIIGCNYVSSGNYVTTTISGTVIGCNNVVYNSRGRTIILNSLLNNTTDFRFPVGNVILKSGANCGFALANRNALGKLGRIACEDYQQVYGAYKAIDAFGDIIKTACDGTGNAPSQDPTGQHGYCVEASNIQSNCGKAMLNLFEHRLWLSAGAHTISYKVQTTYASLNAGSLILTVRYVSSASPLSGTEVTNSPAIATRTSASDWSQKLEVTINSALDNWVDLRVDLKQYEAGKEVYVWPTPTVS